MDEQRKQSTAKFVMGPIGKKLQKNGVKILPEEEDPLRVILRRLISKQGEFPPVEIRQKHYHPDGKHRTKMDEITDEMFEQAKKETKLFDNASNAQGLFNSILKMQLSSMESDARAKERRRQGKLELLGKQLERADLDNEVGENQVHASAVVILREERHLVKASTEVSIVRQVLDSNTEESHLRQQILQENLAEARFKRQAAELDYIEKTKKSDEIPCPPRAAAKPLLVVPQVSDASLVESRWIPADLVPMVERVQPPPPKVSHLPPAPGHVPVAPRRPRAAVVQAVTETVPRFKVTNLGPPAQRPTTRRRRKVEEGGV